MRQIQISHLWSALLALLLLLPACKQGGRDPDGPATAPTITLSKSELLMPGREFTDEVPLTTTGTSITAEVPAEARGWLSAAVTKSSIKITVKANPTESERRAVVTLSAQSARARLTVVQASMEPSVVSAESAFTIPGKSTEDFRIPVIANVPFEVYIPDDVSWIVYRGEAPQTRTLVEVEKGERTLLFATTKNESTESRQAAITFRTKGGGKTLSTISVTQSPFGEYDGHYEGALEDDIKHTPSRATASNPGQSPDVIERSFDGDYATIYHSTWVNSAADYFPITVEYFFDGTHPDIDYIVYHPRKSGNDNGNFRKIELWTRHGGSAEYVLERTLDCGGTKTPTRIDFPETLTGVEAVKFVILSGAGDGQGFAAISEMEFYEKSGANRLPEGVFTDETLSALQPGVTEEQISQISNPLYHDIALHLFRGNYPTDLRVRDYQAWPDPHVLARRNKNNPLNLLDNPTGISVKAGEEICLFVGKTEGRKVSLRLIDFDKPGGDGYGSQSTFPLVEGANKIIAPTKGQLYILYHEEDYRSAPAIRIHLATGRAQGFYDSTQHSVADYERMLSAAPSDGFFDIVGERAHLIFPVSEYRRYAAGEKGKRLIDLYDELVRREETFQGHYKYDRANVNRALFHVMYHAYMYATWYRTAYNVTTLGNVLDPDELKKSPWGPAHEMGHCLQVRPNLLWVGMTEVTNNLQSLNIQTAWCDGQSRIQQESMRGEGGYFNRYDKAYSLAHVAGRPFCRIGDVFCNLVPFWQLQLYYSGVKGQKEVYMDIYEKMRRATIPMMDGNEVAPEGASQEEVITDPDKSTSPTRVLRADGGHVQDNGLLQLRFYKQVCEVVGEDLTDFFDFWGFFRTCDEVIDDYGEQRLRITDEMVRKVQEEVKALGLPKPAMPLQYISDGNWQVYRDRKSLVVGSSGQIVDGGKAFTLPSDWKNYVAIEILDPNDKLIGFANNPDKIAISGSSPMTTDCKVYVVDYAGKRTSVPLR